MTTRPDITDCRHEPPYPDHRTVLFAQHGGSTRVIHEPSERCQIEEPHTVEECREFDPVRRCKNCRQ